MGGYLDAVSALDAEFHMHTYARKPVMFVRGEGMRLTDDDGREYLDFVSGIGAVNLGHSHPAVVEAVREQIGRLTHVSNLYYVEHRDELAREIATLFGVPSRVFFCNSGTEATEGRHQAGAAVGEHAPWAEVPPDRDGGAVVPRAHARGARRDRSAQQAGGVRAAAVRVHPRAAQRPRRARRVGRRAHLRRPARARSGGGRRPPVRPEYLAAVRELCDERDVLLVFDEVQTGLWRCGTPFASQHYGVQPDIAYLAKSLANGLPAGAIVARAEVADAFAPGDHGSTFGGGPVIAAAARACLRALQDEKLGDNAVAVGEYLRESLRAFAQKTGAVADVRGVGLMNAIEFTEPIAAQVAASGLEKGLVLNSIGTHILRILPPLVCGRDEVDTLLTALYELMP